jgi:hypothetical protein
LEAKRLSLASGLAGESELILVLVGWIGCGAAWAVGQDGVVGVACPGFEVGAGGYAGLFVPASAFGFGEGVGLGVVVEVVGSVVEEEVGAVEAAVLPGSSIGRREDGIGEGPVEEVVGGGEADDGGPFFVAGAGVGVPCTEILSVDFDGFAGAVEVLVAEDGA